MKENLDIMNNESDILKLIYWFRDEYIDPRVYGAQICYDDSARKLLCTMFIEFIEEGKNSHIVKEHQETFFKLIKRAKNEHEKQYQN